MGGALAVLCSSWVGIVNAILCLELMDSMKVKALKDHMCTLDDSVQHPKDSLQTGYVDLCISGYCGMNACGEFS